MGTIKKYNRKRIGEVFTSSEGYSLEVVDGGSKSQYCTILVDGKYETEASTSHVKNGKIKNLLHRSICGIGCIGIGSYSKNTHKKAYQTWRSIIRRAYDPKFHEKYPTYKDVTVCTEWHNFQNFAKWFEDNYIDGYHIDKDLLGGDNKIYSLETSVFIPQALNTFLANSHSVNTSGKIGVCWDKRDKKWLAQIRDGNSKCRYLGCFDDIEEASKTYQSQREIYAKEWQEKMQGILPQHAIERIA